MLDGDNVWLGIDTDRPGNLWDFVCAASEARGKYEMIHDKSPWLCVCALNLYCPFLCLGVLPGTRDSGGCPNIQLQRMRITLEPICNLRPHIVSAYTIDEYIFGTFGAGAWTGQVGGKLPGERG